LTNLETSTEKLLQIVLIGQPELDEKLNSQSLRQLKQRISLRCRLGPLSAQQTREYIERRLWFAGAKDRHTKLFSPEAIDLVHRYSTGIPRLINTISESALITSFALKDAVVAARTINEVAVDLCLTSPATRVEVSKREPSSVPFAPRVTATGVGT